MLSRDLVAWLIVLSRDFDGLDFLNYPNLNFFRLPLHQYDGRPSGNYYQVVINFACVTLAFMDDVLFS